MDTEKQAMGSYVTRTQALDENSDLKDRIEIIDALYRFGLGQDIHNRELFASAFAEDAVLDFRPAAEKCGLPIPVMNGKETIVKAIPGLETHIDTTHVVSNCRVIQNGDEARLSALVEAQHIPKNDRSRHALLKNLYDVLLVREGQHWVVKHMLIDNVWFTGEPKILIGE